MSAAPFRCPSCHAALRDDPAAGPAARVRCSKCGSSFRRDEARGHTPSPLSAAVAGSPGPARRSPEADGDLYGVPADALAKKVKGNRGLVLGLVLGGGAGVAAVAAVVVLWVATAWNGAPQAPAAAAATPAPTAVTPAAPAVAAPDDGVLAADALGAVKKATVHILVTRADGGAASGSGFFEVGSGRVLTNAHVVGGDAGGPPRRIDVVLRSGEADERAVRGRVLGVDRGCGLAVLGVDLAAAGLAAPPAALALAPAGGPRDGMRVFVAGVPAGDGPARSVAVGRSSVAGLARGGDGRVSQVLLAAALDPGDAGGPVVDSRGEVVGVAGEAVHDDRVDSAVPADDALHFLNGHLSEVGVGDPIRAGGRLTVPVNVVVTDPLGRITGFSLEWWEGDPRDAVPAGAEAAGAAPRNSVAVVIDPATGKGRADLPLAGMPGAGKVLWVQPTFVNGANRPVRATGMAASLSAPIDVRPAALALLTHPGQLRLTLNAAMTSKFRAGDGQDHAVVTKIETRWVEAAQEADGRGLTPVSEAMEFLMLCVWLDGHAPPWTPRVKQTADEAARVGMTASRDAEGTLTEKGLDYRREATQSHDLGDGLSAQLLQCLDVTAVPLPAGPVQPGQTWTASRDVPLDAVDRHEQAAVDLTYTYCGVRTVNGREFGVVEFEGAVRPAKGGAGVPAGRVHGEAAVDLAAGRVFQARVTAEATLQVEVRGETLPAAEKVEVTLRREDLQP